MQLISICFCNASLLQDIGVIILNTLLGPVVQEE